MQDGVGSADTVEELEVEKPEVVDVVEWTELGARLAKVGPEKYAELLEAVRKITEAQEVIAEFDWQLLFGERPSKRYHA